MVVIVLEMSGLEPCSKMEDKARSGQCEHTYERIAEP